MKNKFTWIIVAFIVGVLIGCAIIWMCCCGCCKTSCKAEHCKVCELDSLSAKSTLIDTIAANTYYHTYHSNPDIIDTLKGFTINLEQFHAMCMILNADTTGSVHGFRIYMGADSIPANKVMMVVGTGSPDKTAQIYLTSAAASGPCPFICDTQSPITK
jgi:hypothetical protein